MRTPPVFPKPKRSLVFMLLLFSFLFSCDELEQWWPKDTQKQEPADVVHDWYKLLAKVQFGASPQPVPILNFRNFGYIGVGVYEAVHPGIKGSLSLSTQLYQMPAMPTPEKHKEYLWGASANAALASLAKQLLSGLSDADKARIDSMENAYNIKFKSNTTHEVIARSQAFGRSIANAIYNWSTTDNFNLSSVGYTIPVFPGSWELTPPAFPNPVGPYLKNQRPFLASTLNFKVRSFPYTYSEDKESNFYKANKHVYDIGKSLTDEQKAIANWWADAGGTGVGIPAPYHALSLITGVLEGKKLNLGQAAEMYARTGICFKEATLIIWKVKYQLPLLRPITYIRKHIDPAWLSYLPTPPYPEYPSGLVGFYAPAMQVLKREFGDLPIKDNAYGWRGDAPREYASISKLVEEAAKSRVYAGIHYQITQNITIEIGNELGDNISKINLNTP
ncbi:vanadium-dependent haloperoxidase [Rhodocytophaga rosea]|uniref:Vanadium-dependent haloperoxidase n=1 Tax=Rhodocytophaga rosea TaxID=2704465 RepID=A0A6C0GSH5_9BACT|nr:vanadium-dependent haloperoxidase [Rhodocytophaga rosea]QHT70907.1 vanadium-dependent haloperoxidase [Rhodocytophaga rosea]